MTGFCMMGTLVFNELIEEANEAIIYYEQLHIV